MQSSKSFGYFKPNPLILAKYSLSSLGMLYFEFNILSIILLIKNLL